MKRNRNAAFRTVLCLLVLWAAAVLQTSLSLRLSLFGIRLELLPLLTVAAGTVMGAGTGFVCGLFSGLLLSASGSGLEGILPIYYMLCGIAAGAAGQHYRGYELRVTAVCTAAAVTVRLLLQYLFVLQFSGTMTFAAFFAALLLRLLPAVVLSPLAVALLRLVRGKQRTAAEPLPDIQP